MVSHRARRSESGFENLSMTLRAKGDWDNGSVIVLWTKKTVPIAPLPSTLMARRLSKFKGGNGDVGLSIVRNERKRMRVCKNRRRDYIYI